MSSKIKVYHLSRIKNRASIFKHGLKVHSKKEGLIQYHKCIFVSIDLNELGFDFVDYENVDCWEFEVEEHQLKQDKFSGMEAHFYIQFNIPPEELTLIATY